MLIFVPVTKCIDTNGTNDPDYDALPVDDPEYVGSGACGRSCLRVMSRGICRCYASRYCVGVMPVTSLKIRLK